MVVVQFIISCLAVFLPAWLMAVRLFRYQPLAGALFYLCLVLIQITVIQLVVGIAGWLTSTALLVGSIVSGLILFLLDQKILLKQVAVRSSSISGESGSKAVNSPRLNDYGILLIAFISFLIFSPVYPLLTELVTQVFLVHPLSWDVVSYHLPNVLDYLQTGSLWTTLGEFSQYPGGNELLQIWSFLPLKSDLLLGINTATIGLGFLLVSTLLLTATLPNLLPFTAGLWTIALWVALLSIPPLQVMLFDFGRNDLTAGFWALVALWCLQKAANQIQLSNSWLLGTGISLGMMAGTKPYGIYYVIGFVGLIFSPLLPVSDSNHPTKDKALAVLKFVILPIGSLAGFWYFRNLVKTGHIFDTTLVSAGAEYSIIRNLFNPAFYQLDFSFFLFVASLAVTGISIVLCFFRRDRYSVAFRLMTGFSLISLIALAITPFSSGYPAGGQFIYTIQSRFGVASIPIFVILTLVLVHQVLHWMQSHYLNLTRLEASIAKLHRSPAQISTAAVLAGLNLIGLVLVGIQFFSYQPPLGLPGFDTILFAGSQTPSHIYAWTQKNVSNAKIYSIGLRPYGLYGFPFSNRVAYEQGSAHWSYQKGLAAIRVSKPQFIAIGVDPFEGKVSPDIALLAQQPQAFKVVYQDNLAAVFQVLDLSKALNIPSGQ